MLIGSLGLSVALSTNDISYSWQEKVTFFFLFTIIFDGKTIEVSPLIKELSTVSCSRYQTSI